MYEGNSVTILKSFIISSSLSILTLWGCKGTSSTGGGSDTGIPDSSSVGQDSSSANQDSESATEEECTWPVHDECPDLESKLAQPVCSKDDWCWKYPTPSGITFRTVWDDGCVLYAGGNDGFLLSISLVSGEFLEIVQLYDDEYITQITGFPDGRLVILHVFRETGIGIWDGEALEELPLPEGYNLLTIHDVEVDKNGDLYVTGEDYDELSHSRMGFFARWDGDSWERIATDVPHTLHEMAIDPCGGIYILGGQSHKLEETDGCGVFYWDYETLSQEYWSDTGSPFDDCVLLDIDVGKDGAVWAAGEGDLVVRRTEAGQWEEMGVERSPEADPWDSIAGVAVESDDSVILAGMNAIYWNGSDWIEIWNHGPFFATPVYDGIYAGDAAWFVRTGGHLTKVNTSDLTYHELTDKDFVSFDSMWLSSSNTAYIIGINYTLVKPAIWKASLSASTTELEDMVLPDLEAEYIKSIWGIDDDDIWAVGPMGTVLHYTGGLWENVESPVTAVLIAMWGDSSDNVFFVGDMSTIVHWDGSELLQIEAPTADEAYTSIWAENANDVYVTTSSGGVVHYDGVEWAAINATVNDAFLDIAGRSASDMFISGYQGVYSFDGENITIEDVDASGFFESISIAPNTGDVYITTGEVNVGKVLHLSGGEWRLEDVGTFTPLREVCWGENFGYLLALGELFEKVAE